MRNQLYFFILVLVIVPFTRRAVIKRALICFVKRFSLLIVEQFFREGSSPVLVDSVSHQMSLIVLIFECCHCKCFIMHITYTVSMSASLSKNPVFLWKGHKQTFEFVGCFISYVTWGLWQAAVAKMTTAYH